jgi:WD40 repeat protein
MAHAEVIMSWRILFSVVVACGLLLGVKTAVATEDKAVIPQKHASERLEAARHPYEAAWAAFNPFDLSKGDGEHVHHWSRRWKPTAPPQGVAAEKWQLSSTLPLDKLDGPIGKLAFTPDGNRLVTIQQRKFTLWDLKPKKPVAFLDKVVESPATWATFAGITSDGKACVLRMHERDKTGKVIAYALADLETGAKKTIFKVNGQGFSQCVLSPDGKYLVEGRDFKSVLWDAATGQQLAVLSTDEWVRPIAFTPDSNTLLAGASATIVGNDGFLKAWDIAQRKELFTLKHPTDLFVHTSISANGKLVASTYQLQSVRINNLNTGKQVALLTLPPDTAEQKPFVVLPALSPNGSTLAVCRSKNPFTNQNPILLLDVASGKQINTFNGHETLITALIFSSTGELLASGDNNGGVKVWQKYR